MDPRAFPPNRQRLSTRAQLELTGITRAGLQGALRRGQVVRVRRGVYSTGPLPPRARHLLSHGRPDPAYLAEVRAVLLQLGPDACAGGRTAAVLWGFDLYVEPRSIEVAVPRGSGRSFAGVTTRQRDRLDVQRLPVLGLAPVPVLSALQTVVECALTLGVVEAVVVTDSALRSGAVTRRELAAAVRARRARPGAGRLRRVLTLSDEGSGSVLESVLRVLLVLAGIPRPQTQFVVRDGDAFVGRVDLCWPDLRLVVECDGRRWHDPDDARTRDRRRDNALERLSWRVLRFTWADVAHDLPYVLRHVRGCLDGWRAA